MVMKLKNQRPGPKGAVEPVKRNVKCPTYFILLYLTTTTLPCGFLERQNDASRIAVKGSWKSDTKNRQEISYQLVPWDNTPTEKPMDWTDPVDMLYQRACMIKLNNFPRNYWVLGLLPLSGIPRNQGTPDSGQSPKNLLIPIVIHHHQNPL
jgi:hypothetical protein